MASKDYKTELIRRRRVRKRALELCNDVRSHEVPRPICCVYFLLRFGRLVYIGQTTNLHERAFSHRRDKPFDEVLYMECNEDELADLEMLFIAAFAPPLNYQNSSPNKLLGWRAFTKQVRRRLRRRLFAPSFDALIRRSVEKLHKRQLKDIMGRFDCGGT